MDKSKLSVILFGSSVFFAIALALYWFYYLPETDPSTNNSDNTEEKVHLETDSLSNQKTESKAEVEEFEPQNNRDSTNMNDENGNEDHSKENKAFEVDEEDLVQFDEKSEDGNMQPILSDNNKPKNNNPNSSPGNNYNDSLHVYFQAGDKNDLVKFLSRLINNIKLSSENDVIIRSIMSQQTLKKALGNTEINIVDPKGNGKAESINIRQLIDRARILQKGNSLIFNEESININDHFIESIEVNIISDRK